MTEVSFLDVESIAIQLGAVVSTLQMVIEDMPQNGQAGQWPDVLALCRDSIAERAGELEKIAEGLKPSLKAETE